MRRPFALFTIPMLLGVVYYYYIHTNIYLILSLFVLTIIINLIGLKLNHSMSILIFISFFLLGVLVTSVKIESSQLIKYANRPIELTGTVKDVKSTTEEGRYVVQIHSINDNGKNIEVSEKTLLKVLGDTKFQLGDMIIFSGILKEPLPNTNPKLFNYKLNLLSNNIYTTITIKDYSVLDVRIGKLNILLRLKIGFIRMVEEVLDLYLTEKNSSLMKAILLGNYSYLDENSIQQFRDLGLAHILAVSGLHIGIITSLFILLFAYMGVNRKINIGLTIGIIWVYGYMIGNPPSVLRANIMFSLLLLSQLWAEPYDSINTLFFAMFISIVINPFWIFSVGFQLSFIATFFIIYFTDKLSPMLYSKDSVIIKPITGILSVQIGLFPILAYYFNRIPIISIVPNILLVPIFTICLILCIFLMFFSLISSNISHSIGVLINALLKIQSKSVEILNYFPVLNLRVSSPSIIGILIYYLIVFILFRIIDLRNLKTGVNKAIIFYLLFLILLNTASMNFDSSISIDFIDVGQGDSILLKTKRGNYLIDTGGSIFGDFDVGKNILLPYLEKGGIFKLKGVFISHFDGDHCKTLPYLMDNIKIENIYFGYERENNTFYQQIKEKAFEKDIPITLLKKGDSLELDRNIHIYVLGPNDNILKDLDSTDNNLSLVLLLNYYNRKVLFTGDIERLGEENVISSLDTNIDFLKVPHHGSNTSSGEDFLNKLNPNMGFISVGRNNSFGHPHKEVMDRYRKNNVQIYRTDELGLINLTLNRKEYKVTPFLKERWSIIDIVKDNSSYIIYLIMYFILSYKIIIKFLLTEEDMEKVELQGIY
ncbi:DNA internalization-related competence protein ComEC/Rec2 [Clostridium sp. Cult2]|uniref:DNA internalization-related competence protein ComEC/Rec2 n=1 Tax=Clostridium sp. Cult2 TaxID=2079003 RepID=UPI001F0276EC|nr:DNA internalization-related competence protein ComEC/Rec2 [Clostridium sp. Cult2]MCF6465597.1 DNA internalization-related competence protein ComEC/Rec2 [Clostridium sp. Cult2]